MSLAQFSVNQRVFVNILFVVAIAAGALATLNMPIEAYPDVNFATAEITTIWPGAGAEEVERQITRKLEDEIDGISGVLRVISFSQRGVSRVIVKWREDMGDAERQRAMDDLRSALDRVDDLPAAAETPVLFEVTVDEIFPAVRIVVVDEGTVGPSALQAAAEAVRVAISNIDGVSKVNDDALRDREVNVSLDRRALDAYDLSPADVALILQSRSLDVGAGSLTTRAGGDGDGADAGGELEALVIASGEFQSLAQIGRTVIVPAPAGGRPVLLDDIATIKRGLEDEMIRTRFNGQPALALGVIKKRSSNAIQVVNRITAALPGYIEDGVVPLGTGLHTTIDSTQIIRSRMTILGSNLGLGMLAVIVALWVFLGWRNALLAMVGVPFAFLSAMLALSLMGVSLNALTLFSLVLISGLVVDDAIIVLENIYRHIESGRPLRQAVIEGAREVTGPVTASILTTMAAFLPLLVAEGSTGEFFKIIPKTVIAALLASLVESLVVLPVHYLEWGARRKPGNAPLRPITRRLTGRGRSRGRTDTTQRMRRDESTIGMHVVETREASWFVAARRLYERLLLRLLRVRYLVVAALIAVAMAVFSLAGQLGVELYPSDFQVGMVMVRMPAGSSMDATEQTVARVDDVLLDMPEDLVKSTFASVGLTWDTTAGQMILKPSVAMVYAEFADSEKATRDPDMVMREIRDRMKGAWATGHFDGTGLAEPPTVEAIRDGPPVGMPVSVRIQTDDLAVATRVSQEIQAKLEGIPGVVDVRDNLDIGGEEMRIRLREPQASQHGLTFSDVAFALAAANEGAAAVTMSDPLFIDEASVRVQLQESDRQSLSQLLDLTVRPRGSAGIPAKLREVATLDVTRAYEAIYHHDGTRAVLVTAEVDEGKATSAGVNGLLQAEFADIAQRYPGVELVFGGEFEETQVTFDSMYRAFLIALLLIFAILATQFRSYTQPLLIMVTIPLGVVGVILALWLSNLPITIMAQIAIVGLAGVIVNDALVLIDFANNARRKLGLSAGRAIMVAARTRLRPVILTTLTTVLGLAPMAFGLSGYSKIWSPFAMVLMAGISFATVLTLVYVPCMYVIFDEVHRAKDRLLRRLRRGHAFPRPSA